MATTEGSLPAGARATASYRPPDRQPDPAARFRRLPRTVQLTETVAVVGSLALAASVMTVPVGPEGGGGGA